MDNIKKFEDFLDRMQGLLNEAKKQGHIIVRVEDLENAFPELKESEDERIRKWIIDDIRYNMDNEPLNNTEYKKEAEKAIAWLKKQNKHQQLYIRFGNIPSNEKSKIYRGEEEFGYENGVSVYPAFEDVNGNIVLGLSLPITKTTLYTQQHLIEYDDRLCYLVKGDYVGKGADGEPLIKNVRIIKEIKPYRMKQDKENNIYIINNTPNCSISVYNEELKESEDERIRKGIIATIHLYYGEPLEDEAKEMIAWLEKQDNKSVNIDIESMVSSYEQRLKSQGQGNLENNPLINMCVSAFKHGVENTLEELNLKKLEKQGEQKSDDKVEPKFKVGEWCIDNEDGTIFQIVKVLGNTYTYKTNEGKEYSCTHYSLENDAKLWTIKDAKDGDVLICKGELKYSNGIKYERICLFNNLDNAFFTLTKTSNFVEEYNIDVNIDYPDNTVPATKEQKEILFMVMKDAGYEFDFEKKELKKIEQEPAWSKEDENRTEKLLGWINTLINYIHEDAMVSLDLRMERIQQVEQIKTWLKSLGPQSTWKPSEGQIKALWELMRYAPSLSVYTKIQESIESLYSDLKKL